MHEYHIILKYRIYISNIWRKRGAIYEDVYSGLWLNDEA